MTEVVPFFALGFDFQKPAVGWTGFRYDNDKWTMMNIKTNATKIIRHTEPKLKFPRSLAQCDCIFILKYCKNVLQK